MTMPKTSERRCGAFFTENLSRAMANAIRRMPRGYAKRVLPDTRKQTRGSPNEVPPRKIIRSRFEDRDYRGFEPGITPTVFIRIRYTTSQAVMYRLLPSASPKATFVAQNLLLRLSVGDRQIEIAQHGASRRRDPDDAWARAARGVDVSLPVDFHAVADSGTLGEQHPRTERAVRLHFIAHHLRPAR